MGNIEEELKKIRKLLELIAIATADVDFEQIDQRYNEDSP